MRRCGFTNTPQLLGQEKYRTPATAPSFFPSGEVNCTPIHLPTANLVSPIKRMIPGRDPLTHTFSSIEKSSTESLDNFNVRFGLAFGIEVLFKLVNCREPISTDDAVSDVVKLSVLPNDDDAFEPALVPLGKRLVIFV